VGPTGISFFLLLVVAVIAGIVIDRLLRPNLRALVDGLVEMPAATTFYVRAFSAAVFLGVLSEVFGGNYNLKPGARFMEYVWEIASNLSDVLQSVYIIILIFATIIIILLASLRRKH
jgi:hypothetical protein